jgi:hypothetical protein
VLSLNEVENVATTEQIFDQKGPSKEQIALIEQFEADYNAVDHFLRKALRSDKYEAFTRLAQKYANLHERWGDAELLTTIAKIRNVIVHEKTEPFRHIVIPTSAIAEELRQCKERGNSGSVVDEQNGKRAHSFRP